MANAHSSNTSASNRELNPDAVCLRIESCRGATVVTVSGELDASNIHRLTDCARRFTSGGSPFILDLSKLDFLAAQGIRVLFTLDDECQQSQVKWALVPGRPVERLLRICDTDGRLPTAGTIDQALQRFSTHGRGRQLLQLVP